MVLEQQLSPEQVTCHQLIARSLKAFGIKIVFGLVGIPITETAFELQHLNIQFIGHRSEQAATLAASCYAYLTSARTSLPGLALTTGGPGFVNAVAGVAHATVNRWPFVLIAGSADRKEVGKGAFQELNQIKMLKENREICKDVFQITTVTDVYEILYQALTAAVSGVAGGVYVDIPTDVLQASIDEHSAITLLGTGYAQRKVKIPMIGHADLISENHIRSAVRSLAESQSPLIVFGKGVGMAHCEKELLKFIDESGIPFLPTPMGRGIISDDHPLSLTAERSRAMREADVVLFLGCRLNWILHFGEAPRWRHDAKFFIVDLDRSDCNEHHTRIRCDLYLALKWFLEYIPLLKKSRDWILSMTTAAALRKEKLVVPDIPQVGGTVTYAEAFSVIKNQLKLLQSERPASRITLVAEGSKTMDLSRVALPVFQPRGRLDAGTWGTMGVGLAYAIAASLADPDPNHYVVGVEGDAAIGFSLAELETITRYRLPILLCVFNNGGVYTGISAPSGKAPLPTQLSQQTNYGKIMEAVGGVGYRVTSKTGLADTVRSTLLCNRVPTLIDIVIDPYDGDTPATAMGRIGH